MGEKKKQIKINKRKVAEIKKLTGKRMGIGK